MLCLCCVGREDLTVPGYVCRSTVKSVTQEGAHQRTSHYQKETTSGSLHCKVPSRVLRPYRLTKQAHGPCHCGKRSSRTAVAT